MGRKSRAIANRSLAVQVMAKGGEILVANVVRQLAEGKDFMFGDRGEPALCPALTTPCGCST